MVYVIHANSYQNIHLIFNELNEALSLKTYLVSHKLTIADVVLYYLLCNVMAGLTPIEKELYMNISRWFDNIQQIDAIRQSNKLVNFSSNYFLL
ncbi:hypothetical protein HHI36_001292 [Cryptolaemus montrouzieri]|uniref:GST C-terminal domain-containing protein n=1 Tax=Cryptolaemus montrouzieri TaxID=559131 RepID=A0ABD2P751_9CUCU